MSASLLDSFKRGILPRIIQPHRSDDFALTALSKLWAGYGYILLLESNQDSVPSKIVKLIAPPAATKADDEGHTRKVLSYRIEANFYKHFAAAALSRGANVPFVYDTEKNLSLQVTQTEGAPSEYQVLVLENLRLEYPIFTESRGVLNDKQVHKAVSWLAHFHAAFWDIESREPRSVNGWCPSPLVAAEKQWHRSGLWEQGGYHYLSTRITELKNIDEEWGLLGLNASSELPFAIDWCLANPVDRRRLSLIHGDVKAANMAFNEDASKMAMYDFQYVGKALGVQDLAKFITTSISGSYLEGEGERALLQEYHGILIGPNRHYAFEDLWADWELALVSWVRFLAGWSGGFWGNVEWLQARARGLLEDKQWTRSILTRYAERETLKEIPNPGQRR